MLATAHRSMTVEELLHWDGELDRRYQLIDGDPVMMAPASWPHGHIVGNLIYLLRGSLAIDDRWTLASEVGVVPPGRHDRYFVADLVVAPGPARAGMLPEPVLVAEVLSPATISLDRSVKLPEYRRTPSVQEILLISRDQPRIEHHHRVDGDRWDSDALEGLVETLELFSFDISLRLEEVYCGIAW